MDKKLLFSAFLVLFTASPAFGEQHAGPSTGLPVPRFASLRADEVNMRTGPGTRYPIEWVFRHRDLPLEVTAEYDVWRRVKDWDGAEGWVHQSALSGHRTLLVKGTQPHEVKGERRADAPTIALVDPGAIGRILDCEPTWCKVRFGTIKGYLPKSSFWGTYPDETW